MSKRKRARRDAKPTEHEPRPLLQALDALWLVASVTIVITVYELWYPDTSVSNAQIIGLAVTLGTIAVISRHVLNQRRSKRAK